MSGGARGRHGGARPTPATVEVHVERLVLHGFAGKDRHRIGEAVERELARLLEGGGVPPALHRGFEVPRLDTGSFEMEPDCGPETIGARVARAVYRGLRR